jgi:hypothetical protein
MNDQSPTKALRIALEKRILNEFASKILNEEKLDSHNESRRGSRLSEHSEIAFHCECDDDTCTDFVSISAEEYSKVHMRTRNFVVLPSHVRLDIEEIIMSFPKYVVVGKFFPHPTQTSK